MTAQEAHGKSSPSNEYAHTMPTTLCPNATNPNFHSAIAHFHCAGSRFNSTSTTVYFIYIPTYTMQASEQSRNRNIQEVPVV